MRSAKQLAALALLACGLTAVAPSSWATDTILVHGQVFEDADSSGTREVGERLLAGMRLTNGVSVVTTNALGAADVWVNRAVYRFATLTVPAGFWPTTPWFHRVPVGTAGPDTVEFGLKVLPASAADVDSISWAHISDTQVDVWGHPFRMDVDLAQIDELADRPLFIINTGDLVEVGSDSTQWTNYVSQLAATDLYVFPVVGNHDTLSTATPLQYYEQYVGPPYYSFEAGRWHFIVYNDLVASVATPLQDTWLANDVAAAPPGSRHLLFQHYMLQEMDPAIVQQWASMGMVAAFSGHWHTHQFNERPQGMLEFNVCRTRSGPLDRTPRTFGVVSCTRDGEIHYDLRRLHVDHRSEISSPQPQQVLARGILDVFVQAYDTSSLVASVSAGLSGPGGSLAAVPLVRDGVSLWRGTLDATFLPMGAYTVTVGGSFEDGTPISRSTPITLSDVVPIRPWPGTDWPMFRRCSAGSSFVATALEPPLSLVWSVPVPGMVALSSPVVKQGRVYVGCRAERDVSEAGVLACDAETGAVEWFRHLPGGVALAPAVDGGVVIATALSDSVFGLDASTGARLWSVPQVSARYSMTAPIFQGDLAWVGAEPRPMEIQPSTGILVWRAPWVGDPWFPYIYSAPSIDDTHVAFGFFGSAGEDMGATTGGLRILDRQNGSILHQETGAFRSPIYSGGTLYVVGGGNRNHQVLTARTPTGAVQWTASPEVGSGTGSPALGKGILVVPGNQGAIQAFRASDGQNLWTKSVGLEIYDMESGIRSGRGTPATPAISDSVVWIGSLDGNLYALDLMTGAERWRWRFGAPVASSAAISGNMLFVAAEDEHLYGFVADHPEPGTGVSSEGRASVFTFYPPRPNPSMAGTRFAWVMATRARTRLQVFDVGGRLVRTVAEDVRDPGEYEVVWDGRDRRGWPVVAGVYFARLESGDRVAVHRFVRLHGS